ncbi:cupin domain-containing protein [Variovorax sp. E3]|uniref:cupin domain-containing protein n=1 Tax=Variovorax sp. E3 TaxID=1914993 RepID=UPI0018DC9578|nr:cupin domain-containing protein [Variovorax sp. E3]
MQPQEAAIPSFTPASHRQQVTDLQSSLVMRALGAGWTTLQDRAFLVPILAWTHSALLAGPGLAAVRHEGENSTAYDAVLVGEQQACQYESALEALGAAAISECSAPSFAKYFVISALSLYDGETSHVMSALVRGSVRISQHLLAVVHLAIERGCDVSARKAEPAIYEVAGVLHEENHPALEKLLVLYFGFLADLHAALRFNRMEDAADRIQARTSLEKSLEPPRALYPGVGEIMCIESDDARDVRFTVERYPCTAEVLDPRVVRIPAGKYNNRHKHAHETLFCFISGTGEILVGETWVKVGPGDAVFSPRWAIHQTHNTGTEELVLLAITDYYLTSQVYVGKYDKV